MNKAFFTVLSLISIITSQSAMARCYAKTVFGATCKTNLNIEFTITNAPGCDPEESATYETPDKDDFVEVENINTQDLLVNYQFDQYRLVLTQNSLDLLLNRDGRHPKNEGVVRPAIVYRGDSQLETIECVGYVVHPRFHLE